MVAGFQLWSQSPQNDGSRMSVNGIGFGEGAGTRGGLLTVS